MLYLTVVLSLVVIPLFVGWLHSGQVDPDLNPEYYL